MRRFSEVEVARMREEMWTQFPDETTIGEPTRPARPGIPVTGELLDDAEAEPCACLGRAPGGEEYCERAEECRNHATETARGAPRACGHLFVLASTCQECARFLAEQRGQRA